MILNSQEFADEIAEIKLAISKQDDMKLMFALVGVYAKGMVFERNRIIPIIQAMAVNPMPIVNKIRKPLR
jgi:hypothetical protein